MLDTNLFEIREALSLRLANCESLKISSVQLASAIRSILPSLTVEQLRQVMAFFQSDEVAPLNFPPTELSRFFNFSFVEKIKTDGFNVSGSIELSYEIPVNMSSGEARYRIISSSSAQHKNFFYRRSALEYFSVQPFEKSENLNIARRVSYTLDFDSGDLDSARHLNYAKDRDSYIVPMGMHAIGAGLYFEQTGMDLARGYSVRVVGTEDDKPEHCGFALVFHNGSLTVGRRTDGAQDHFPSLITAYAKLPHQNVNVEKSL